MPLTAAEIGDVPIMLVMPVASPGSASHATPPDPLAVSTKPSDAVDEVTPIIFPEVVVDTEIGKLPSRLVTDTAFVRVWNSLVSIHSRDGSAPRRSPSNSS